MSPDVWFLLVLAIKMAVAAAFVVTASFIAERAGALVGAMVVTLPIAAGPAYILLALDHGAAFVADSTVASLAVHAASGIFGMAYVFAAQRRSFAVTIAAAVGTWIACALAIRAITWSVPGAILVNVAAYGVCVPLAQRYLHVRMPVITRRWFDIPLLSWRGPPKKKSAPFAESRAREYLIPRPATPSWRRPPQGLLARSIWHAPTYV